MVVAVVEQRLVYCSVFSRSREEVQDHSPPSPISMASFQQMKLLDRAVIQSHM